MGEDTRSSIAEVSPIFRQSVPEFGVRPEGSL